MSDKIASTEVRCGTNLVIEMNTWADFCIYKGFSVSSISIHDLSKEDLQKIANACQDTVERIESDDAKAETVQACREAKING